MDLFVRLFLVTFIGLVARAERAVFMGRELLGREWLAVQGQAGERRIHARAAKSCRIGHGKGQ